MLELKNAHRMPLICMLLCYGHDFVVVVWVVVVVVVIVVVVVVVVVVVCAILTVSSVCL